MEETKSGKYKIIIYHNKCYEGNTEGTDLKNRMGRIANEGLSEEVAFKRVMRFGRILLDRPLPTCNAGAK